MKIGISVSTYYPQKNGVQFVTQNLAEGLVKSGHEVTVITRMYDDYTDSSYINGVKVFRCNIINKYMFHFGDKKGFHSRILNLSNKVDVMIFVCLQSVAADWSLDFLDKIKCQKIVYMHGMHEFRWKRNDMVNFRNFIYKILRDVRWGIFYTVNRNKIGKFDKFIHLHEEDSSFKYFEKKYPNKNYILENFVEDMFFLDTNGKQNFKNYYIYIANYHDGKNQLMLLKAFYLMKKDFKLIFIGSERNKYYFDLLKKKNSLDRIYKKKKDVMFLYGISRNELSNYLKGAFGYTMTSKSEHYPISLIEAMSSGLPVISTDVGIVKYLPGCIIVRNKPKCIAKAMDQLIENKELYLENKRYVINYAKEHFDYNKYISKFEKIISF